MVKVTVGEQKPQVEKPFPKLMIIEESDRIGLFLKSGSALWLTGMYAGVFSEKINMSDIIDFNEPIMLQNA